MTKKSSAIASQTVGLSVARLELLHVFDDKARDVAAICLPSSQLTVNKIYTNI
jgi:hypothetical protein